MEPEFVRLSVFERRMRLELSVTARSMELRCGSPLNDGYVKFQRALIENRS